MGASTLYSFKYHLDLYGELREDGLVSDDLDTVLSTLPSKTHSYRRSQVCYTLNDTFIIDFRSAKLVFFVIIKQRGGGFTEGEELPINWISRGVSIPLQSHTLLALLGTCPGLLK
jgi:hypothetical protein